MRSNYNVSGFLAEVQRIEDAKQDVVVSTDELRMTPEARDVLVRDERFGLTDHAEGQIAERLGIPRRFFQGRLDEFPEHKAELVNAMFRKDNDRRMVRTLDGRIRAYLSDRFRPWDNAMLIDPLTTAMNEVGDIKISSTSLTETNMYLQALVPSLEADIDGKGDVVYGGFTVRNSEVGAGALAVEAFLWRQVCSNGMIARSETDKVLRKYHVGRTWTDWFSDETMVAELQAFRGQIRDALTYIKTGGAFQDAVDRARRAAGVSITKPETVVRNVTKRFKINGDVAEDILRNMADESIGGSYTLWGVANGITALAHTENDRDRQYEYERIGNDLLSLSDREVEELVA